jgi:hypothetical protein
MIAWPSLAEVEYWLALLLTGGALGWFSAGMRK